jgi:hypothetical protein
MWGCVTRLAVTALVCFLACCSEIPTLITEPGMGPPVRLVVNHINCELASIIASNPYRGPGLLKYNGPVDPVILEREAADPELRRLLPRLQYFHFVTSVLLTIDTTDTEGIFPSASFILPTSTIGVGGQWNGSQERNVQVAYSIDLAKIGEGCDHRYLIGPDSYLNGSLRLGDIVADGLTALDATSEVNAYSSGGPTTPAFDATIDEPMMLTLTCADYRAGAAATSAPNPSPEKPLRDPGDCSTSSKYDPLYEKSLKLALLGNVNFTPASDPQSPGAISFSGRADIGGQSYLANLTGSTIAEPQSPPKRPTLKFTLSGNMTQEGLLGDAQIGKSIGFSPNISLVGTIQKAMSGRKKGQVTGLNDVTGLLTPSTELPSVTGTKIVYSIAGPSGGTVFNPRNFFTTNQTTTNFSLGAALSANSGSASNPSTGSASATVKSSAASSANSTQFGSLVSFVVTYGINGGPNWTLTTFKGPGGGSGPNGQLLTATRAHTATLQLTFVAACYEDLHVQIQQINTFWESIPKCSGTQQSLAAANGQALNYLAISGRGGH